MQLDASTDLGFELRRDLPVAGDGMRCTPSKAPLSRNRRTCSQAASTPAAGSVFTRSTNAVGLSMSGIPDATGRAMARLASTITPA
jgi:hypothetical protein